ncbi:MAG: hypothetical protein GY850_38495 [bacterium]|nr:hypothetical protein [bacterium]
MFNFHSVRLSGLVLFCFLSACARVPVESFKVYTETFDTVQIKGNAILDEVAKAIAKVHDIEKGLAGGEEADQQAPTSDQAASPEKLDPKVILADTTSQPPSVAARRNAFNVATQYNATLLKLAEGQSMTELQQSLASLKSNAWIFVAGSSVYRVRSRLCQVR